MSEVYIFSGIATHAMSVIGLVSNQGTPNDTRYFIGDQTNLQTVKIESDNPTV